MKKFGILLGLITLLACAAPVSAKGQTQALGNSNTGHLNLYQKCQAPSGFCDWLDPNFWGPAWGKMKYDLSGLEFNFDFDGHGLKPETNYTLIYYPQPTPGNGLICLGSGVPNNGGALHINNSLVTGSLPLPIEIDENYIINGADIRLVKTSDVKCETPSMMVNDNPTEYLFSEALISFTQLP